MLQALYPHISKPNHLCLASQFKEGEMRGRGRK